MKFIVKPTQQRRPPQAITMCALCSEDPQFCGDWI
jgi:hypothetical protein